MTPTHKLPPHLGQWPCRSLHSAASNELGQMLTLVEYTTDQGTHRIYVNWNDLTRIVAPEPTTPYAIGADGYVYRMLPGKEPGTQEGLWHEMGSRSAPVLTWGALTIAWEEEEKTHPIIPLEIADAWLDKAPELPLIAKSESGDRFAVVLDDDRGRQAAQPIRAGVAGDSGYLTADEAEEFGYALLRAAHKTRAKDQR